MQNKLNPSGTLYKTYLSLLLFVSITLTWAQTPNEILAAELDSFILSQLETTNIPGISSCIVKEGKVVYSSAFGIANYETETPVTLDTKFTLASISKLFVATACAQLWEEGLIDLDANINNYLPISIVNPNFPDEPITARQLLHHKSSLKDYESDLQLWDAIGDPSIDLETFCNSYFVEGGSLYVATNWGNTSPSSSSYWYSNAGFTLLGYLVEEVTEMPFDQYCKINIQDPLQMPTAAWFYTDIDTNSLAMPYSNSLTAYGYYSVPEYPASMLKCNVEELAHFLTAYTQNGLFEDFQLVNEDTFSILVPDDMMNGLGWWGKDTWYGDPNGDFWSHGGFMNGVRTQLNYYPEAAAGLIILTNGEASYMSIQQELEAYIPLFETESIGIAEERYTSTCIFPNPTTGAPILHLDLAEKISSPILVTLTNSLGELVLDTHITNQSKSIEIATLTSGIYFLTLNKDEKIETIRLIVE